MAVFGMESSCIGAPDASRQCGTVCLESGAWAAGAFHGVHNGDVVFIKAYTPQAGLDLWAVGVVLHDLAESERRCIPVDWVWSGKRHLDDLDDQDPGRSEVIYEEYNLTVQREVLDLLPTRLRLALP